MVMAAGRQIAVQAPWPDLLPDGGLRRGSTVVVSGDVGFGVLSVVWSLMAGPTQRGHWTALVGIDDPGVVAMVDHGVSLSTTLFVPRPRDAWAESTADLLGGVDLVVVRPPSRPSHGVARRLVAKAKERRAVLVVVGEPRAPWPVPADVTLSVTAAVWQTTTQLRARELVVRLEGRGSARREGEVSLWVPTPSGHVAVA